VQQVVAQPVLAIQSHYAQPIFAAPVIQQQCHGCAAFFAK
jgi:hypothetical protein